MSTASDEVLSQINQLLGDWELSKSTALSSAGPSSGHWGRTGREWFYTQHAEGFQKSLGSRKETLRCVAQSDPNIKPILLIATDSTLSYVNGYTVETATYSQIASIKFECLSSAYQYSGILWVRLLDIVVGFHALRFSCVDLLHNEQGKRLSEFVNRQLSRPYAIQAAAREFQETAIEEGMLAAWLARKHSSEKERTEFIANVVLEAGSRRVKQKYNLSEDEMIEVIREAFKGLR